MITNIWKHGITLLVFGSLLIAVTAFGNDDDDDPLPGPDRSDWYGSLEACCRHYRTEFEGLDQRLRNFEAYKARWLANVAATEAVVEQKNQTQMDSYARYHTNEERLLQLVSSVAWFTESLAEFEGIRGQWTAMSSETMFPVLAGIRIFDAALGAARPDSLLLLAQQIPVLGGTSHSNTEGEPQQWQAFAKELGLAALSARTTRIQQEQSNDPDSVWDEGDQPEQVEQRPLILVLAEAMANGATALRTQALNFETRFLGFAGRFEMEKSSAQHQFNALSPQVAAYRAAYEADHSQYQTAYNQLLELRSRDPERERQSWVAAKETYYKMWHRWSGRNSHDARCIDNFGDNGDHRCE